MSNYVKLSGSWREISFVFKKVNGEWVQLTNPEEIYSYLTSQTFKYGRSVIVHTLMIGGASNAVGSAMTYNAIYDGNLVSNGVVWAVASGSSYATIDQNGELTILQGASESPVTITAVYEGVTATKNIYATYEEGTTSVVETATETQTNESGQTITTTTTTTTTTDGEGNTTVTETTTQIIENEDGSLSSVDQETTETPDGTVTTNTSTTNYDESGNTTSTQTSEVVENPDGSSSSNTVTVNYDESGNTTGSQTNQTIGNADGSYGSNTTNYDGEGNPTDTTNQSGDTAGNVDTQQVEYNESGTPVVTSYEIDTTGSNGEGKEIEGNGVNTEFVPFKFSSEGFVIDFDFESTAEGQPRPPIAADTEDTGTNYLYTVLGAKTTMKVGNIWPGFEIRWVIPKSGSFDYNDTSKCFVQICRTFSGETSTSRANFTSAHCANNVYHLTFIYDPLDSNKFKARNNVTNSNIMSVNKSLQDNVELDLTIGYSTDHNGNQIRHSSLIVHDFSVAKLNSAATVANPTMSCVNNIVTLNCATQGSKIYYKVDTDEFYDLYKGPIEISANTTFNVYSIYQHKVSSVKTSACTYVDGTPAVPVITCDGDYATITCSTQGVSIYYKVGENGEFVQYSTPIEINENVTVYAYSQKNGLSSTTVNENCVAAVIASPSISCDGTYVTITCETTGTTIHYKLGENGTYTTYTSPIEISSDTLIYAYATRGNKTGTTASALCEYEFVVSDPTISYDGEYATITTLTQGASIYYKLGSGEFSQYSSPVWIEETTTVYAYAALNGFSSNTVSQNCTAATVSAPTISCDGENVTISCETQGSVIHYKLNQDVNYSTYTNAFAISADTTVYAYATLGARSSTTVSELCEYSIEVSAPVISCELNEVTITCATEGADIYYRFDTAQGYSAYTGAFTISALTFVQAYAALNGVSSTTVDEICVYEESHDYSQDYLTFNVSTTGDIKWKSFGSGYAKTIEYSINGGTWTSITSTSAGVSIPVTSGDKVRFRGENNAYAGSKSNYSGFEGGTAYFDIEGNINSLLYGDNFASNSALTNTTYQFCSIFKKSHVVSAENLILPATILKDYCYRAMFSYAEDLIKAPSLPATTLAKGCYWYMFEGTSITSAPELLATTFVAECYGHMFEACSQLNYIKCLAVNGLNVSKRTEGWVRNKDVDTFAVQPTGTFVKDSNNTSWTVSVSGIPQGWIVVDDGAITVEAPTISYDLSAITMSCETSGADIYYKLNQDSNYTLYSTPISISANTIVMAFATMQGTSSLTTTQYCEYVSNIPFEESNRTLGTWVYNNNEVQTPYSVNAVDGHSGSYATGNSFNFETNVVLRQAQPTYLWFQHADQSADVYVDGTKVDTHWGGYNAFFSDISNYVHSGTNVVRVGLCNKTRNTLAPCKGDFNYNATLGNVKLFTSPVLPAMDYGYDGFHVTSDVTTSSATVNVKTTIPVGAVVWCTISGGSYTFSESANSTSQEMAFTATIPNPHLWHGKSDPYLYNITLEIYHDGYLYHKYERGYGLRFFQYAISGTTMSGETGYTYNGQPYTGFLLNGQPYFLRGVCMHDDLAGKANALNDNDYTQEFAIIQELGCNFIRLAHYPHPKEVYDWCDRLGIIVQTEVPWVGAASSGAPTDYYTHLEGQYRDMVNQHYNHPCIVFWGLSNETSTESTTDAKNFIKDKIEGYTALIKSLDQSRWVGYVMSHSYDNPSSYYNNPEVDWFGCNIYVGWYISKTSNDPTSQLTTRVNNIIKNRHKPLAYSEYGCGGTQRCHSESADTTTTKGTNQPRHDIEYMMWLHEGHLAAIKSFPQLLFTGEWQLFDIAVYNRQEGYTVCLDGETTSTDNELKYLNNKGLVERDHITKKDPFYLYKAEWNPTPFVHICGQNYLRFLDREIKCYTNDGNEVSLYKNGTLMSSTTVTNHIAVFSRADYVSGDVITVSGATASDTFIMGQQ